MVHVRHHFAFRFVPRHGSHKWGCQTVLFASLIVVLEIRNVRALRAKHLIATSRTHVRRQPIYGAGK